MRDLRCGGKAGATIALPQKSAGIGSQGPHEVLSYGACRQWVLKTFGLWGEELDYVNLLLSQVRSVCIKRASN